VFSRGKERCVFADENAPYGSNAPNELSQDMATRVREAMPPNAVNFYLFYSSKGLFSPLYEAFLLQISLKFTALHATQIRFILKIAGEAGSMLRMTALSIFHCLLRDYPFSEF
jgi:hypothetical protein